MGDRLDQCLLISCVATLLPSKPRGASAAEPIPRARSPSCKRGSAILPRAAAWYAKRTTTFSDALAAVQQATWAHEALRASASDGETQKVPRAVLERLTDLACYAAGPGKVELSETRRRGWRHLRANPAGRQENRKSLLAVI